MGAARRRVERIKQYYVWREQVRSDLVRVLAATRRWHLALAARFVSRGWLAIPADYFLLLLEEVERVILGRADAGALGAIVADRIATRERQRAIQMPLLMRESELPALIRTAGIVGEDTGRVLTGHPVSGGCVEDEVVVVREPGDFARMKRGAILVAPATDPSWTPLFTLASGLIVEVGGVLSHASTIAREYGCRPSQTSATQPGGSAPASACGSTRSTGRWSGWTPERRTTPSESRRGLRWPPFAGRVR